VGYDLYNCKDCAGVSAYQEMIREIIFVMNTRVTCLNLNPNLDGENSDSLVNNFIAWLPLLSLLPASLQYLLDSLTVL
jgi:hypothetical protein